MPASERTRRTNRTSLRHMSEQTYDLLIDAVMFIVDNDEPTWTDPTQIKDMTTVLLVAQVFAVPAEWVADHVVALREQVSQ